MATSNFILDEEKPWLGVLEQQPAAPLMFA